MMKLYIRMINFWNILWLTWVAMATVNAMTYGNGMTYAEFDVQCDDNAIYVLFNKTKLDERTIENFNIRDYKIYFQNQESNAACILHSNTSNVGSPPGISSIFASAVWIKGTLPDQCGISESYNNDYIVYSQTVVVKFGVNPRPDVRREEYDYYHVNCLRNRTINVRPGGPGYYNVTRTVVEKPANNKTASFSLSFSHTDVTGTPQTSYALGDFIQFTLSLDSIGSISSVIQECFSSNNGSITTSSFVLRNRCPLNNYTEILSYNSNTTVFKTQAYRSMGLSPNAVYLTCIVRICPANNQEAECQQCNTTTLSRKRRETEARGQMAVIDTPIFYIIGDGTNPSTTDDPSNIGVAEQQDDLLFIEGTGGTILIVVLSVVVVAVLIILAKVFVVPAISTASTYDIPPQAFKNQMETEY